jgi:hypothetical protein
MGGDYPISRIAGAIAMASSASTVMIATILTVYDFFIWNGLPEHLCIYINKSQCEYQTNETEKWYVFEF